jgi:hypothetical protein
MVRDGLSVSAGILCGGGGEADHLLESISGHLSRRMLEHHNSQVVDIQRSTEPLPPTAGAHYSDRRVRASGELSHEPCSSPPLVGVCSRPKAGEPGVEQPENQDHLQIASSINATLNEAGMQRQDRRVPDARASASADGCDDHMAAKAIPWLTVSFEVVMAMNRGSVPYRPGLAMFHTPNATSSAGKVLPRGDVRSSGALSLGKAAAIRTQ